MEKPDQNYGQHYSGESFWKKVKSSAKKAGARVLNPGLVLYHTLQDPKTPAWAKVIMVGALGYFILPLDVMPDFLPGVGYTDDLGTLIAAVDSCGVVIREEHRAAAKANLSDWFGEELLEDLPEENAQSSDSDQAG